MVFTLGSFVLVTVAVAFVSWLKRERTRPAKTVTSLEAEA